MSGRTGLLGGHNVPMATRHRARLAAAGVGVALALSGCGNGTSTRQDCEARARQEIPGLRAQAKSLLARGTELTNGADCESGTGPVTVYAGLDEDPEAVVKRMKDLGDAVETRNDECLKYL